jgi:hypothetical protein
MERSAKEKISRAEVYLHQCRENRSVAVGSRLSHEKEGDSSFSADPGDTSVRATAARLNPLLLAKPSFVRTLSERRTTLSKHVHFHEPQQEKFILANRTNQVVISEYGPIDYPPPPLRDQSSYPLGKTYQKLDKENKASLPVSKKIHSKHSSRLHLN